MNGYCKEGENHCVCGGDLPSIREGCGNWVKCEPAPVDMLLFCPECGQQHIDGIEDHEVDHGSHIEVVADWKNPPHRSHLCHACGCIWRPADVPTNGVAAIKTRGTSDTWGLQCP